MLKLKKALIFDLDGTLADTIDAITEAVNLTLEYFRFPIKSYDDVKNAIGNGARMLIKRLIPDSESDNEAKLSEVVKHYDKMYATTYLHTREMYDGMKETVLKLHNAGLKIAVFSNKQDAYVKGLVNQYFPNGEIQIARGQTDIPTKPDPCGVSLILRELEVEASECVFVGDSGVDLKTAQNSGMDFIGVAWGFCGKQKLYEMGADLIADAPEEILNMLNI